MVRFDVYYDGIGDIWVEQMDSFNNYRKYWTYLHSSKVLQSICEVLNGLLFLIMTTHVF